MERVSAKLGVASESAVDLSCGNGVPEMAEYCEKVPREEVVAQQLLMVNPS